MANALIAKYSLHLYHLVASVFLAQTLGSCPMPLLRQNLGNQHWMCIPTTILATVTMKPSHNRGFPVRKASPWSLAAKEHAANTLLCAPKMRCCCNQWPRRRNDQATDSSRQSWSQEPRRVCHLLSSFQGLWSPQPCPKQAAAIALQTDNACPI